VVEREVCHVMGYGFGMILGKFRARKFDISKAEGNYCWLVNAVRPSGGMMGVVENE
jgi:hypothetical protein